MKILRVFGSGGTKKRKPVGSIRFGRANLVSFRGDDI